MVNLLVMEGKVIEIKQREKLLPLKEKKGNYCAHKSVEVDPDARVLSCAKCGAYIDPFGYILQLAYQERNIHAHIELAKKEYNQLAEERDKLKSQISYLRSQAKKLNKGL